MQSLKKIHAWAQMKVPLCRFSPNFSAEMYKRAQILLKRSRTNGKLVNT